MIEVQLGSVTFGQGDARSRAFLAHDFLRERDRVIRMVSLCSAGHDASIDMHIDLIQSPVNLEVT